MDKNFDVMKKNYLLFTAFLGAVCNFQGDKPLSLNGKHRDADGNSTLNRPKKRVRQ